jgi:subtilase family serine protease
MRRRSVLAALVGAALAVLVPVSAQGANGHASYRAVCPSPLAGYAHCHELVVTDSHGNPQASSSPTGLAPATIQSVYGFPTVGDSSNWASTSNAGHGKTIAIVDAYDDPTAENDLGVFSSQYGLPDCTTANGCFQKVDQTGGSNYPGTNSGWALEISLDVQWAHAIAPGAKILLVEASSNSFTNLLAAEDYAASHAQYVSNSWGGSESSGETSYDSHFAHSGVSFFVSAGDSGLPAEYPSASPNVISVGGTTLHFDSSGAFTSETGWSSGGGGCSAYETANAAQAAFAQYGQVSCSGYRATPDVSLDADPNSGVSVYDSTKYQGQAGWFTVGGTSASSPMWAAASADTNNPVNASTVYGTGISFRDITSGNNGASCLVGYDLCSGRGSWLYSGGSTQTADFTISATPSSQTVTAGGSTSYSVTVAPNSSFSGSVTLSLTAASGISGTFSSNPTSSSSTLNVSTGASLASGAYTLTITGSGDGVTHSTTVSLTVGSASASTMSVTVTAGGVSQKGPNYRVPLTVSAADSSGAPISGASVTLNIYAGSTCAGTPAASGTGTTGSNGQAGFTFSTRQTGGWCAQATVSDPGYATSNGSTTFST